MPLREEILPSTNIRWSSSTYLDLRTAYNLSSSATCIVRYSCDSDHGCMSLDGPNICTPATVQQNEDWAMALVLMAAEYDDWKANAEDNTESIYQAPSVIPVVMNENANIVCLRTLHLVAVFVV